MVMNMKDNLNGLSLDDQMKILSFEGLLVDGAFGDVTEVTVFEPAKKPQRKGQTNSCI